MSTPIPSPSMKGTIGLSGVGRPGTIFSPAANLFYIGLPLEHSQPQPPETFFNPVIPPILPPTYAENHLIFGPPPIPTENIESDPPIYRSYYPNDAGLRECFERIFADFD